MSIQGLKRGREYVRGTAGMAALVEFFSLARNGLLGLVWWRDGTLRR